MKNVRYLIIISFLSASLMGCAVYSKTTISPEKTSIEEEIKANRFKKEKPRNYKVYYRNGEINNYGSIHSVSKDTIVFSGIHYHGKFLRIKVEVPINSIKKIKYLDSTGTRALNYSGLAIFTFLVVLLTNTLSNQLLF